MSSKVPYALIVEGLIVIVRHGTGRYRSTPHRRVEWTLLFLLDLARFRELVEEVGRRKRTYDRASATAVLRLENET